MNTHIEWVKQFDKYILDYLFKRAGEEDAIPNPEFFDDEKNIFLVSHTEEQLSGFLWAYILISPHTPYPEIFLYSIDVFSEFRRQGIASQLIGELKNIARTLNCREMFVPTSKNNQAAVALYRGTGGIALNYDDGVTFTYDREALNE